MGWDDKEKKAPPKKRCRECMRQVCICDPAASGGGKAVCEPVAAAAAPASKPKSLRKGDRVMHPSRGGGSITGRMADMVYVLYDSGEDFEYLMDDALEKLTLEDGGSGGGTAPAPAKPKAEEPVAPPMPARAKARKGSIEATKPLKEWEKPIAAPPREAPVAKKPQAAVPASHRESEAHTTSRSSGSHKGKSSGGGGPQVGPGPREGNDPCVQLMELPVPLGPEDGAGNYRRLLEEWNKGPRTDSGQALPIPDDEEDGIDELTLAEGDKPSKRLRNPVPLQSLITTLGDIWTKDNVL